MPINRDDADKVLEQFKKIFPIPDLIIRLWESPENCPHAKNEDPNTKGLYTGEEISENGITYHGYVDIFARNKEDTHDMHQTLLHETVGHYGINTFKPDEKKDFLNAVIDASQEPTMKTFWDEVNETYLGESVFYRAEEVITLAAERLLPGDFLGEHVQQKGKETFQDICVYRKLTMQEIDLHNILCMIAQGLHRGIRQTKTFAEEDAQFFKKETQQQEIRT